MVINLCVTVALPHNSGCSTHIHRREEKKNLYFSCGADSNKVNSFSLSSIFDSQKKEKIPMDFFLKRRGICCFCLTGLDNVFWEKSYSFIYVTWQNVLSVLKIERIVLYLYCFCNKLVYFHWTVTVHVLSQSIHHAG